MAELVDSTEGRGDGGERVGGELRRRQCFGCGEREMSRGGGRARESGRGSGRRVATFQGVQGDEKGARQAGREVAWRGGVRARRARSPPSVEDEDDRGGQWAGPALAAGPARPHRSWAAGKFLLFISVFYFSDICFDLIKILNHFITLCQFLQELAILFQSSPTGGIIFGHILIYITNIFPMQIFMH